MCDGTCRKADVGRPLFPARGCDGVSCDGVSGYFQPVEFSAAGGGEEEDEQAMGEEQALGEEPVAMDEGFEEAEEDEEFPAEEFAEEFPEEFAKEDQERAEVLAECEGQDNLFNDVAEEAPASAAASVNPIALARQKVLFAAQKVGVKPRCGLYAAVTLRAS